MKSLTQSILKNYSKGKIAGIVITLSLTVTLVIGSLFAFFSDAFSGSQDLVAGTLDISGGAKFYINDGKDPASKDDLECINPGDKIKVVIDVENKGSKSAWLRGSFDISAEDHDGDELDGVFTVYKGDSTAAKDILAYNADDDIISFADDGKAVLDGTYEKEKQAEVVAVDRDAIALGKIKTDMIYTIVFEEDTTNDYQDAKVTIEYEVKAIQYRNNAEPEWDTVEPLISNENKDG